MIKINFLHSHTRFLHFENIKPFLTKRAGVCSLELLTRWYPMKTSLLIFFAFCSCLLQAYNSKNVNQLVLVLGNSQSELQAQVCCFEKKQGKWHRVLGLFEAVIGKNGLAWDPHFAHQKSDSSFIKKEGDLKTPMGIFPIRSLFGHESKSFQTHEQMPYRHFTSQLEGVDDSNSPFYNQIVDTAIHKVSWTSSEKLGKISVYRYGAIVGYNDSPAKANEGSFIFFHIWKSFDQGTAGCVALDENELLKILNWLNLDYKPQVAIFEKQTYDKYQPLLKLPQINE